MKLLHLLFTISLALGITIQNYAPLTAMHSKAGQRTFVGNNHVKLQLKKKGRLASGMPLVKQTPTGKQSNKLERLIAQARKSPSFWHILLAKIIISPGVNSAFGDFGQSAFIIDHNYQIKTFNSCFTHILALMLVSSIYCCFQKTSSRTDL